jgi:hypothetical protein
MSASSKTAMVASWAQVPPEIWMTLSMEAKKWLLNERKRQQQEVDKMKKSSSKKDTIKMLQSKHHFELNHYRLPSPRGLSKQHMNLVIWFKPRSFHLHLLFIIFSLPCL